MKHCRVHHSPMSLSATSTHLFNTSKNGDSITSLSSLFLTNFSVKKFFLISRLRDKAIGAGRSLLMGKNGDGLIRVYFKLKLGELGGENHRGSSLEIKGINLNGFSACRV